MKLSTLEIESRSIFVIGKQVQNVEMWLTDKLLHICSVVLEDFSLKISSLDKSLGKKWILRIETSSSKCEKTKKSQELYDVFY